MLFLLFGCSGAPDHDQVPDVLPTKEAKVLEANAPSEANNWTPQDEVVELFVTIADTGRDYRSLDIRMYRLSEALHVKVDTLGRYHDRVRDSLMLPLDDEDELYAGQYVPRRYEGNELSIEYLDHFDRSAQPRTYALVTGLWGTEPAADSALLALRRQVPHAYKLKARIYQGCMH